MNILITGASGLVATEFIHYALSHSSYNFVLVTRDKERLIDRYDSYRHRIIVMTLSELLSSSLKADVCIHTAFTRSSEGARIAESLDYLKRLCEYCIKIGVKKFVNISSQSVYGDNYTSDIRESAPCAPSYMYALGKFSSELICEGLLRNYPIKLFNIRLASVCENARFVKIFVQHAITGEPIIVTAPHQTVSFIDVRDVASALYKIVSSVTSDCGVYNLGSGQWYDIQHVANRVKYIAEHQYNLSVSVETHDGGVKSTIGMNIDHFRSDFNWSPEYNLDAMIGSLFEMLTNPNGGGLSYSV